MNHNVAVRAFLSVFRMDVFIILSATSDCTLPPVFKWYAVIIGVLSSGEFT